MSEEPDDEYRTGDGQSEGIGGQRRGTRQRLCGHLAGCALFGLDEV